ncbi:MAG: preprotein translocase subunit SecA, partial [Clostridia bacterium]|nr:preprotein translocase subunit SecA [Clostridia bacterium]
MSIFSNLFGDYSHREIKRIQPLVRATLALEEEYSRLSDDELKAKTPQFKERLANGETLDDLLPEAFATCREAAWRILEMKHFPVQVEGGIILHQGRVAEMKTGEGKTLVATLPAYLNALTGNGVHVVTVNDYLARRDSEWMGKVYRFLGLSVGLVINERNPAAHTEAYAADITYGTNNEMGFDYLRDNMVTDKADRVQRGHNFAIVDEVDSILIDEARTPLIISGMSDKSTDLYRQADDFVSTLKMTKVKEIEEKVNAEDLAADGDYIVDEKARTASLTKRGIEKAEKHFGVENLMDSEILLLQHHIDIAVKAHGVMHRDTDYIVKDGEVLIVDEFTGRIMIGRRYNDGLHQAIEAKEHVEVNRESKTVATITLQNYFRLYSKLSGMTGTAMTEQEEFQEIYSLDCVEIPTNKPMIRVDHPDVMYKKEGTKLNAIVQQIKQCHEKGQPVLVGTVSIEKSEHLSKILRKEGVPHQVLNAKNHEKEAEIIAQAGKVGAVTIATNMAGRGTDIILGGNAEFLALSDLRRRQLPEELIAEANAFGDTDNEEILEARRLFRELEAKHKAELSDEADRVREAGGLFIIGTERQESRRVDNQLRGRAGRQGDPGESRFYISAEDDLVRLFAGDRFYRILDSFKSMEETPIDIKMFSQTIESAQKRREGTNFAIRKNVLKYDDVMNQQRTLIYDQRNEVLDGERPIGDIINDMIERSISDNVDFYLPANL